MQRTGPDLLLIRDQILREISQAEAAGRLVFLPGSLFSRFRGSRSGLVGPKTGFCPRAGCALIPIRTLAGAGLRNFGTGCPAPAFGPTKEKNDTHRPPRMPSELVAENHA